MSVEIKFDANQQYQLDAIKAVVDLFEGQEAEEQSFALPGTDESSDTISGFDELVFANSLSLSAGSLIDNLAAVQDRPRLLDDGEDAAPMVTTEARLSVPVGECPEDYSLEMETGTGKTYVYLRTIAELNKKYGFRKFVIVVPSIAIREGVLTSLDLLKEHLRELYDGLQFDYSVYDSRALTRVRQFATASHLQILVMNIDAFTKDTNVINRPTDAMNGYAPIEFLRACRPIVIMDEPQNMESDLRKQAIASLNPLFKLRYSATHRDVKHLVYRLTPVDAYRLRLVKRVGVRGITQQHDLNLPFVEIKKITASSVDVTATAVINKLTAQGTKPTTVTIHKDDDLVTLSGGLEIYRGWSIEDIHAPAEDRRGYVEFSNHRRLAEGSSNGEGQDQLHRIQIRQAIESHFEREREFLLKARAGIIAPMKPLTLFFIDRVAHYADADGKYRRWFEEEYEAVRLDPKNKFVKTYPVSEVHDGYFASTPKGEAKEVSLDKTTGLAKGTADVNAAFEKIMRNKQTLLDLDEPLRFVFSHSALGEGWDNPNVFVICNLQEGTSVIRKRQQIGRGMRLPVMSNGERCAVEDLNHLTVIASESFETFAAALQREIKEDTGVDFTDGGIVDEKKVVTLEVNEQVLEDPLFKALWEEISPRTRYRLSFETSALIESATDKVKDMPKVEALTFTIREAGIEIGSSGVKGIGAEDHGSQVVEGARRIPDIVGELSRRVPISRASIIAILKDSGRLEEVRLNPSVFLDQVAAAMSDALYEQLADNVEYSPIAGKRWEASEYTAHVSKSFEANVVPAKKSITSLIPLDSAVEREFQKRLEERDDVKLYLKLPSWFKVSTPLGGYNPDWAIVREIDGGTYLYLVRETKGGDDLETLRFAHEKLKIKFGSAHFESLKVDYAFGSKFEVLIEPSAGQHSGHGEDMR